MVSNMDLEDGEEFGGVDVLSTRAFHAGFTSAGSASRQLPAISSAGTGRARS